MEVACNGGSCGEISLKIFSRGKIAPYEPRLQASFSSIPRIRNRPIEDNGKAYVMYITLNRYAYACRAYFTKHNISAFMFPLMIIVFLYHDCGIAILLTIPLWEFELVIRCSFLRGSPIDATSYKLTSHPPSKQYY